jgi:hypothetical protein
VARGADVIRGGNPYLEFGPGMRTHYDWHSLLSVAGNDLAAPLGLLPESQAAIVFSAVSAALLEFGVTRDSCGQELDFLLRIFCRCCEGVAVGTDYRGGFFCCLLSGSSRRKPNLGTAVAVSSNSRTVVTKH